jgi:hypothetical protein
VAYSTHTDRGEVRHQLSPVQVRLRASRDEVHERRRRGRPSRPGSRSRPTPRAPGRGRTRPRSGPRRCTARRDGGSRPTLRQACRWGSGRLTHGAHQFPNRPSESCWPPSGPSLLHQALALLPRGHELVVAAPAALDPARGEIDALPRPQRPQRWTPTCWRSAATGKLTNTRRPFTFRRWGAPTFPNHPLLLLWTYPAELRRRRHTAVLSC